MSFFPKDSQTVTDDELEATFNVLSALEDALSNATRMDFFTYTADEDEWNMIAELYERLANFYDSERLDHE